LWKWEYNIGFKKSSGLPMKLTRVAELTASAAFAALSLFVPTTTFAQAPPGPLAGAPPQSVSGPAAKSQEPVPLPPPRTVILGAWKLNRDESDDPRQRAQDSQGSNGGRGGGSGGGPRIGVGLPGGGGGGYGGHRGGGESDDQRQKMHELMTPPRTMTMSMTGAEVDLVDDQSRKRAFMTDGRKLQKSKDANYQEIAAKWDGNRLVSDEKDPRGNKMSRTFELSEDGRQLYETLHMTSGRSNTPTTVRYVYDIPAQTRQ
jgi:hypothetical protein